MQNEQIIEIPGAFPSPKDSRTVVEKAPLWERFTAAVAGVPESWKQFKNIYSQDRVGICTAAGLITGLWEATGKRYSEDFQYYLQKKYHDNVVYANQSWFRAWFEGSSPYASISTGYKYGFLPKEEMDKYFIRNPQESYATYIDRLVKVMTPEVEAELLAKCEKVITAYSQTDNSLAATAQAASEPNCFLEHRFECGNTWYGKTIDGAYYSAYYSGSKIEPITMPYATSTIGVNGHQVAGAGVRDGKPYIANTFGPNWTGDGHAPIDYMPTETWKVYVNKPAPVVEKEKLQIKKADFKYIFKKPLGYSLRYSYDVEMLHHVLMFENCVDFIPKAQRGYFGLKTIAGVRKFQQKYGILATGFVAKLTLAKLNELYG